MEVKSKKCLVCGKSYTEQFITTLISPLSFKIGNAFMKLNRGANICEFCKNKYVRKE